MARVNPGVYIQEGDYGLEPARLGGDATPITTIRGRYQLVNVSVEHSSGPLDSAIVSRTWRDQYTHETFQDRVAVAPGEDYRRAYEVPPVGIERLEREQNARQFQAGHASDSEPLRRLSSIVSYLESSRRYSGSRENEMLSQAIEIIANQLISHHNHLTWLTEREGPRDNTRFQQLELRLESLEQTIDLFTNEP